MCFGVRFGGVLMVIMSMECVSMGHFVMMGCFVVIALFVRFVRLVMVMGSSFVVLCSMVMVIVFRHLMFYV
jgi:hypothetical protein